MPNRTPMYELVDRDLVEATGEELEAFVSRRRAERAPWDQIAWEVREGCAKAGAGDVLRSPSWESLRTWFTCQQCRSEHPDHKLDCSNRNGDQPA